MNGTWSHRRRGGLLGSVGSLGCTLLVLAAAPALSATEEQWEACKTSVPFEARVAACTRIADDASETAADRIKALRSRAAIHRLMGDLDGAITDLTGILGLDPSDADSYTSRAVYLGQKGDDAAALADYTAVVRLKPDSPAAYYLRGKLYRATGEDERAKSDLERAIKLYGEAIARKPDDAASLRDRGNALLAAGDFDRAIADFSAAIRLAGASDAGFYLARGDAYLGAGDTAHAIADYSQIIDANPKATLALYRRALAYRQAREMAQAIADYAKIIALSPSEADAYNGRGLAYAASGDFTGAIADFDQAIKFSPDDPAAYYNRAQAHRLSHGADAAITDYSTAIKLDPRNAVAFNSRGLAYAITGDTERAAADYTRAIALDSRFAAPLYNRGQLRRAAGRLDEAIADFRAAAKIDPNDPDPHAALAQLLAADGELDSALPELDAAIALSPISALLYAARADLRFKRGHDDAGALSDADRALLLDAHLADVYDLRAAVHERLNQSDAAAADRKAAAAAREKKRQDDIAAREKKQRLAVVAPPLPVRPQAGAHAIGDERDWTDCAGTDPARTIEACGRIIAIASDRSGPHYAESGADFFDSVSYRAGAYFAQRDFRHAIEDYGRALMSGPLMVAPRLNKAMALWLDGKRDRAVIQFTIAQRIDRSAVDQEAAGHALIASIAELARVSPPRERDVRGFPEMYASGPHPRMGVHIQALTAETAEKLDLKGRHGVLVTSVDDNSPAKRAGIEAGDLIVRFGGEDIVEDDDEPSASLVLVRFVASSPIGTPIAVVIVRHGVEQSLMVTLAADR